MNKSVHFKTDKFIHASIKTETEGSLFHYTDELNTLSTIVETGFRFSYTFEEHSERVAKGEDWTLLDNMQLNGVAQPQYGIATPMICFCDIPLLKATDHRAKFGNYCIGVNKELIRKKLPSLNPLFYYTSNWIYDAIEKLVEFIPTKEEFDANLKNTHRPNSKSRTLIYDTGYYSAVKAIVSLTKKYEGNEARYYNEHEWRVFFTEAGDSKYSFTREQFEEKKKELNNQLWKDKENSYIRFNNQGDLITYIIVSKEKEIPELINKIRGLKTLFGCSIPDDKETFIKDIIISKITSFERIEADY